MKILSCQAQDKLGIKGENATTPKSGQIVNILFGASWIYHFMPYGQECNYVDSLQQATDRFLYMKWCF